MMPASPGFRILIWLGVAALLALVAGADLLDPSQLDHALG